MSIRSLIVHLGQFKVTVISAGFLYGICFCDTADSMHRSGVTFLNDHASIRVSFRRIQRYRNFTFSAEGTFRYHSAQGLTVTYSKPFTMSMIYTDSGIIHVKENRGEEKKPQLLKKGYWGDPFCTLLMMFGIDRDTLYLTGSFDSTVVYNGKWGSSDYQLLVDRKSNRCRDITIQDSTGTIIETSHVYYKERKTFPIALTSKKVMGMDIVSDSLSFRSVQPVQRSKD